MRIAILAALLAVACRAATEPRAAVSCRTWQTTPQQFPTNKLTTLTFDSSECSFSQSDRIVLPKGLWVVHGQIAFAPNDQGQRGGLIRQNGFTVMAEATARPMVGYVGTVLTLVAYVQSDGQSFIELAGNQTSGGVLATVSGNTKNRPTFMSVTRLE